MKDLTISDNIIAILDDVSKKLGLAIDWSSENIVPYIKTIGEKIVRYELLSSILYLVIASLILTIGAIVFVKIAKQGKNPNKNSAFVLPNRSLTEIGYWVFVITTALSVISLIALIDQTLDIIKCNVLPEQIIINYIEPYVGDINYIESYVENII